jgi:hypothetical protein
LELLPSELPNLQNLYINNCGVLQSIPNYTNLTKLHFNYDASLNTLPLLPNLTDLYISSTELITSLPIYPNLIKLQYYNCPNLDLSTVPIEFLTEPTTLLLDKAIKYNSKNINRLFNIENNANILELVKDNIECLNSANTDVLEQINDLFSKNYRIIPLVVKPAKFYSL